MSSGIERPVWTTPEPGSRRPRFTREQIAQTAIDLADAEGLEAVSMRRVAAELGAGTMTLYHYVPTKNDLLALMADLMMGELLVPEAELQQGWRHALTAIARRSRAVMRKHSWILAIQENEPRFGPNGLRHFEQSLAAVEELGLEPIERLEVISLVDDYAFGVVTREHQEENERTDEFVEAIATWIRNLVATGEFPHVAALFDGEDPAAAFRRMQDSVTEDERFQRGLDYLLDGVALRFERKP
ncbi:MAG TPA: TetR/AcrR family transcriptional regulator [Gaiellaceae bacterium]|nr:TetR/AcrR family transcriptional regulator [Gaiellaceae bacterium]